MKKKTRYVILGLIRDEPMTGYEIKQCIDLRMNFFWSESYGQIYPELNEMVEEGLLTIDEKDAESKRPKIYYKITEKGSGEFNNWMATENEKDTIRSESLLKFFLADDNNREDIIRHLETFYQQNAQKLQLYLLFQENLRSYISLHNNHKYILKMLELGIGQQQLYCNWAKEYLKELKGEYDEKTEN